MSGVVQFNISTPYMVNVVKEENGYTVTFSPAIKDPRFFGSIGPTISQEKMEEMHEESRQKSWHFEDIEQAAEAIKEFFLDQRLPKRSPNK